MPIPFARAALFATLLVLNLTGQSVTWQSSEVPLADLAERAPVAATTAAAWLPFARSADYRLVLSDDRQVLLILDDRYARQRGRAERPDVKKFLAAVAATTAAVDSLLGRSETEPPPAVVVAALATDYPAVLVQVAKLDPRLTAWAGAGGRSVTGFVLSEPLVAAWVDDASGREEWDRLNELVHRTAQLLARRRAPQLPPWFSLGLAWHVEDQVRGSIYCFPHRDGFVWSTEHSDWGKRLVSEFKPSRRKRANLPPDLTLEEFADWDPMQAAGGFDASKAHIAFGVARFLATAHTDSFARVAGTFDAAIREGWRVEISETEWTTDPSYRLPPERQLEILQSVDPEFLESVTDAFVRGKLGRARTTSR